LLQKLPYEKPSTLGQYKPSFLWKALKFIVSVNSFIPLIIYKSIEPNIEEIEFVSTTKFAIGITAFPLFYYLQSLVINYFFGTTAATVYVFLSIFSVLLLAKTK
ncbi:MAG: hypothetical protein QNK20_13010, partial [Aureibaculum sp.]|nr:hypothetical protein [Aureibaculum sp.]